MELTANYVDYTSANSLAAVLRWCDTAGLYVLKKLSDPAVRSKLEALWMQSAVMRVIKVEMQIRGAAWEAAFAAGAVSGTSVRVSPVLSRLGRTSYTLQNQVSTAAGTPLARVETVMVQLDVDLQRPAPVPTDVLQSLLQHSQALRVPFASEPPPSCFTWNVQVRPSDCDLLGHMNNASYAVLFEDARHAFGHSARVPGDSLADSDVSMASIEYITQARAFQVLEISVWWDIQGHSYGLCMRDQAKTVVARAALFLFKSARL